MNYNRSRADNSRALANANFVTLRAEHHQYKVQKELLASASPWFKNVLDKISVRAPEERDLTIELQGVTKEVLEHFLYFLLYNDIPLDKIDGRFSESQHLLLVGIWVFGWERDLPRLQDAAIRHLYEHSRNSNSSRFSIKVLEAACSTSVPDSKLHEFMLLELVVGLKAFLKSSAGNVNLEDSYSVDEYMGLEHLPGVKEGSLKLLAVHLEGQHIVDGRSRFFKDYSYRYTVNRYLVADR